MINAFNPRTRAISRVFCSTQIFFKHIVRIIQASQNQKRLSTQVVYRPKLKSITTRRLIESDSQGTENDSAPGADDNVACAPSDQSRDLDGDRILHVPQSQVPATRLAGGHLCNTGMNSGKDSYSNKVCSTR